MRQIATSTTRTWSCLFASCRRTSFRSCELSTCRVGESNDSDVDNLLTEKGAIPFIQTLVQKQIRTLEVVDLSCRCEREV